jgi:hypothetical protein
MKMSVLQILNRQRKPLAEVTWEPPDKLSLEVLDEEYKSTFTAFLEEAVQNGVPFRTGRAVEESGKTVFVDEQVIVESADERFLPALADVVRRYSFRGQRVLGLLKVQKGW